ncbi:hypothetical protein D3C78_1754290 [compost metagenome]
MVVVIAILLIVTVVMLTVMALLLAIVVDKAVAFVPLVRLVEIAALQLGSLSAAGALILSALRRGDGTCGGGTHQTDDQNG